MEAGNDAEAFVASEDPSEEEVKSLLAAFRDIRTKFLEAEKVRLEENLTKKREILDKMQAIVADADNINLHFNDFKELQQQFKDAGDVPPTDETEVWRSFQTVTESFYDTYKANRELRDLDMKKNLEAKLKLIERTIALDLEENIVEASRKLKSIHDEWREIGPVMKEQREKIWEDFKEASAKINRRHQEFFEARKAEEQKNAEAKEAICQEIESIDVFSIGNFAGWDEATEKIKGLQAKWKELGYASRKLNNELFARFRKACDVFFQAKSDFSRKLRESLQANLDKKTALCERVEAMVESGERGNLDEVVKIQAEWKKIGSVPRKFSDSLWNRFTAACNTLFEEKKRESDKRKEEENANLEAKRAIIAKLKEIPEELERKEKLERVKELQNQWSEVGYVPFRQKEKIFKEYRAICDKLYEGLNASRRNEQRRNYEATLDKIKGDKGKVLDERTKLLRAIEQRKQELKTYENNLGFFNVKSAAGSGLFKEMERKKANLETEIASLKEKIAMLDAAKE